MRVSVNCSVAKPCGLFPWRCTVQNEGLLKQGISALLFQGPKRAEESLVRVLAKPKPPEARKTAALSHQCFPAPPGPVTVSLCVPNHTDASAPLWTHLEVHSPLFLNFQEAMSTERLQSHDGSHRHGHLSEHSLWPTAWKACCGMQGTYSLGRVPMATW